MTSTEQILNALKLHKQKAAPDVEAVVESRLRSGVNKGATFANHPAVRQLRLLQAAARSFQLPDPFFRMHEGMGGAHTVIGDKPYINFSHYNYLGLNGHPEVNRAATEAVARYGTSAGASRVVAGERPAQRELEKNLGALYGTEDCAVFVSGHATNVSTISTLFGPGDLVLHDSLAHNSVLEGIHASGATRRAFAHNNLDDLEKLLEQLRDSHKQALIVVEGLYSMDGDFPDLARLVKIKNAYSAFLMVDEAHALGVLGKKGKGLAEHAGVDSGEVDIWMGTLSKTLAACGGYIAGSKDLVDVLKSSAPGFVYSVGISPCLAAAANAALAILLREPERVEKLRENSTYFLELARSHGYNTGPATGNAIVPIIIGSSRKAIELSGQLFAKGVNVQPIIHPAVEEKSSRLRFFLSSTHSKEDIDTLFLGLKEILGH